MGIGEVALRAGLRPSAIRYYESVGLLPAPARASGQRRYDATVLDQLALIRLAQGAGFRVAEIRTLLHGFSRRTPASTRWRTLARTKLEETERQIADARRMQKVLRTLLRCACPTLQDCARAMGRSEARRQPAPARKAPPRRRRS